LETAKAKNIDSSLIRVELTLKAAKRSLSTCLPQNRVKKKTLRPNGVSKRVGPPKVFATEKRGAGKKNNNSAELLFPSPPKTTPSFLKSLLPRRALETE
jgi:hypothetical protein